jgi:tRNA threonylcarbamoyladenosine biosynthesis protein TsaE
MIATKLSNSEGETKRIASLVLKNYKDQLFQKCLLLALVGDLGTGKTVFAKGVAAALGIEKVIRSPGFIIMREFPYLEDNLWGKFVHIDLWRVESEKEIVALKIKDLLKPGNVVLIEWAEKMGNLWSKILKNRGRIFVLIKISNQGKNKRRLEIRNKS